MLILNLILLSSFINLTSATESWYVQNPWNASYEKKFSEFVRILGESKCNTLTSCLTQAQSNPYYYNRIPKDKLFPADCADFPYELRMIFSWMEGLSFDYVGSVEQANPAEETSLDLRYTKFGNKPKSIKEFNIGGTFDGYQELLNLRARVSTATYRIHYQYKSDFYPISIDNKNIKPGTVVYDPSGHAAIIYKIESNGIIKMMDAHPDNSITRITFDKKFVKGKPHHGSGFNNWRPELNQESSEKLLGFSLEQYKTSFEINNSPTDYYTYVRYKLAKNNLKFDPLSELKSSMLEICSNVKDRIQAVQTAIESEIHLKQHPEKLPDNIYGSTGEWEDFATSSRDARLKVAFAELYKNTLKYLDMYAKGSTLITYEPVETEYSEYCEDEVCYLRSSLLKVMDDVESDARCNFSYVNSAGKNIPLSYSQIVDRLFLMSFDPYHCPELRWGRYSKSYCSDSDKYDWYDSEQGLRNQLERTYDLFMGYNAQQTKELLGVKNPPVVDLRKRLIQDLNN